MVTMKWRKTCGGLLRSWGSPLQKILIPGEVVKCSWSGADVDELHRRISAFPVFLLRGKRVRQGGTTQGR
jgi:hypothetical protein